MLERNCPVIKFVESVLRHSTARIKIHNQISGKNRTHSLKPLVRVWTVVCVLLLGREYCKYKCCVVCCRLACRRRCFNDFRLLWRVCRYSSQGAGTSDWNAGAGPSTARPTGRGVLQEPQLVLVQGRTAYSSARRKTTVISNPITLRPNSIALSSSQAGSKQVADGFEPANSNLSATSFEPALRTSFEPASNQIASWIA